MPFVIIVKPPVYLRIHIGFNKIETLYHLCNLILLIGHCTAVFVSKYRNNSDILFKIMC